MERDGLVCATYVLTPLPSEEGFSWITGDEFHGFIHILHPDPPWHPDSLILAMGVEWEQGGILQRRWPPSRSETSPPSPHSAWSTRNVTNKRNGLTLGFRMPKYCLCLKVLTVRWCQLQRRKGQWQVEKLRSIRPCTENLQVEMPVLAPSRAESPFHRKSLFALRSWLVPLGKWVLAFSSVFPFETFYISLIENFKKEERGSCVFS